MEDDLFKYYKASLSDNLCAEYKGLWQAASHDKLNLVRLAMSQQAIPHVATYAYEGRGLSREYLLREFKDYINGYTIHDADGVNGYTYGLYVDWLSDDDMIADKDVMHIMFTKDANVVIPRTKCPIIYVSNCSNVRITCEGYNSPRVYLFDESMVIVDDTDEDTNVLIYKYGKRCEASLGRYCFGNVKVFNKELKL
jgi:hypothetical protein